MIRAALAVLVGLTLVGAVVQLTVIASERVAAPAPATTGPIFKGVLEPEPPIASEMDEAAGAAGSVLTY